MENGDPGSIGTDDDDGSASTGGSGGSAGSTATGGASASGGTTSGSGGTTSNGGGGATGGASNTGGTVTGGAGGLGGASGGSVSTGGVATGGAATGGAATGGSPMGGSATGGTITGGTAGAGGTMGGTASGGKGGAGGTASGGKGGAGGTASGGKGGTGGGAGSGGSCPGAVLTGGTQRCSSNASGNVGNGYQWTIWSSGTGGCITPHGTNATFRATWNNSGDFLARVGLNLGSNRTFDQFGTFSADFSAIKSGTGGGYSYIGIYGWSVEPLHEYYIIDDWYGTRPNPGTKVGTINVDGGTYDILTHTQVNQPAITGGNATFVQFWSLRQAARSCGHISISEHFRAWQGMGMTLGRMYEAKILLEVGGGIGNIEFTQATLTVQ